MEAIDLPNGKPMVSERADSSGLGEVAGIDEAPSLRQSAPGRLGTWAGEGLLRCPPPPSGALDY